MLTSLTGMKIEEYVHQPGVVILDWRDPKNAVSLLFDQVLDRASGAHRDVRFGTIDLSRENSVAREWQVGDAPTVMAFRDGILVFSRPGPLPEAAVNGLIDAIWSLDMDEIRRGLDGHGGRILIAFRGDREPLFETTAGEAPNGNDGPARGAGH